MSNKITALCQKVGIGLIPLTLIPLTQEDTIHATGIDEANPSKRMSLRDRYVPSPPWLV